MKIQGTLMVEGINLHMYVDAPDSMRNLYITNVPPDAMIVMRERISIEALPFSPRVVASLHEKGIFFLNGLLTPDWKPITRRLSEEEKQEILPILTRFLDAALIPFASHRGKKETVAEGIDELQEKIDALQQRFHEHSVDAVSVSPQIVDDAPQLIISHDIEIMPEDLRYEDIRILALPAGVTKELRDMFGIIDVGGMCSALLKRRDELVRGRYIGEKMLSRIEMQLSGKGITWNVREEDRNG